MSNAVTVTALDIGTNSIKAINCLKRKDCSELEVLQQIKVPCFGVRRGAVVEPDKVSESIRNAINEINQESGQEIEEVYVNIGGSRIFVISSHGAIAISRADETISQEDINRAMQAAQAISLPSSNDKVLDVFPKEFIIDGEGGIKEKEILGMRGIRLEANVLALCCFRPYSKNLTDAVLGSGLQIADIVSSPVAAARAVLTAQQKELGVVVIDIGTGTTSLAVYEEGDLIHVAVFPVGSEHITKDIAVGFRIEMDVAEKIKKKFGVNFLNKGSKKEKIEFPQENGSPLVFSSKDLEKIIKPRISDIFEFVNKELKKISRQGQLPAGAVLTGGGVKLSGIVELAKEELKLPVSIGIPIGFSGLRADSDLSTVCGLALIAFDSGEARSSISPISKIIAKIIAKLKKLLKNFIP